MSRSRRERTERAQPELLELLRALSFRRGRVTLASGKESDFFIDCKPTVLTAKGHLLVGELMLDALRQVPKADAVAGVALGGCPLASAVSLMSQVRGRPVPALYVRNAVKDHGMRRMVEGRTEHGMSVVILEDVITTGGSTWQAIQTLRAESCVVVGVVVLVDRLEGGVEAIRAHGLEVVSLFTRHDFIEQESPLASTLVDTIINE